MGIPQLRFVPRRWAARGGDTESSVHTLSPYIGKLKARIARDLIGRYAGHGAHVLDPFCGSGTIPLEAAVQGAIPYGFDNSPYAVLITRAKLFAHPTCRTALDRLSAVHRASERRPQPDLRKVPSWVRRFFHPQTLRDAIRFADECTERQEWFLLACLLGILHHQRPGFLSYPASHLVPYLRDKSFPRPEFPELYGPRELLPRMIAKVERSYATGDVPFSSPPQSNVRLEGVETAVFPEVDAIITSPPYMNALDYRRDNRLRLWFLDRSTSDAVREPVDQRHEFAKTMRVFLTKAAAALRPGGHLVMVVGEMVRRSGTTGHPSETILEIARAATPSLRLLETYEDEIPDIRRARRDCRGTKREHILVLRKSVAAVQ